MNNLIVHLIVGVIGAICYYIERVFIQKDKVSMQNVLKVFLFSFGLSFISFAIAEIFDIPAVAAEAVKSAGASNVILNPSIMTGQPPF
jgi:hypothetical protein